MPNSTSCFPSLDHLIHILFDTVSHISILMGTTELLVYSLSLRLEEEC